MSVKERRTTHFEWACDGPECDRVERVFERGTRPEGWLTAKVTQGVTRAFHTRECADKYLSDIIDDGAPKADAFDGQGHA